MDTTTGKEQKPETPSNAKDVPVTNDSGQARSEADAPEQDVSTLGEDSAGGSKDKKSAKKSPVKHEALVKTLVRIIISIAIIAGGIFIVLYIISVAGQFESMGSMIRHMLSELQLMSERIGG